MEMAIYYIEQHLLSAKVRTVIKDEQKKPVFLLVGNWGSRGDSISIYTLNGDLLASAKQTNFTFQSRFDLFENHQKIGSLSKFFTINRDIYFVKGKYWLVLANIKNQQYKIFYLNQKVMEMKKETTYKGDYFKIDISNEIDAPLCFCIAAVLDYWARREDRFKNINSKKMTDFQLE